MVSTLAANAAPLAFTLAAGSPSIDLGLQTRATLFPQSFDQHAVAVQHGEGIERCEAVILVHVANKGFQEGPGSYPGLLERWHNFILLDSEPFGLLSGLTTLTRTRLRGFAGAGVCAKHV
jgi:hypothetical protein